MVEVWIGTMALQNLQQYDCQTGKGKFVFYEKTTQLFLTFSVH
jgi:hypothetical protein